MNTPPGQQAPVPTLQPLEIQPTVQPPTSEVILQVSLPSSQVVRGALVVKEGPLVTKAGDAIGSWMRRRYAEAAVLARQKAGSFLAYLAFLGAGLTLKGSFPLNANFELLMASPTLAEAGFAAAGLIFVIGMDVYGAYQRRAEERWMWSVASDPATPEETRRAMLDKLTRPN